MRIVTVAVLVVTMAGCADGEEREALLISAAASLTDAFTTLERAFEDANPRVDVVLNLGGSSGLREQILGGAPADVFASADTSNMDQLVAAGLTAGEPRVFARNRLQIAVPSGNPAEISGVEDFEDESLLIGLCAEGVPCGDFARRSLRMAGVSPSIDTNEPSVRSLLTKIEEGELDAGITYTTDVASSGGAVEGIDIAEGFNVTADYQIAVLSDATDPDAAAAFIDFVLSADGQEIMGELGFAAP